MNKPVLELQGVTKSFPVADGRLEVLKGINLSLSSGEVVAMVGHSGSGKTTLLQIAGLLSPPSSGSLLLNGSEAAKASDAERTQWRLSQIGFVYQFHHLLPEFTARENVALPLILAGKSKKSAGEKADALLAELGLKDRADHRPAQLSGGEQQRVSIARALANDPVLLLADEPTGNLDDASAGKVFDLLMQAVKSRSMAVLLATHNLDLASQATRLVRLEGGKLV